MPRTYLEQLEAESIHIFREAVAECKRPVLLYSIGKDSSVLLRLAQKAFAPAPIPFPILHVDTGFKFKEMTDFRDQTAKELGLDLIIERNFEDEAVALSARDAATERYIYLKKTKPLLKGLENGAFDCAFGGARRDEEKSRAKERIFSVRGAHGTWNPKDQRPEIWDIYNAKLKSGQTMRAFPISNWTEIDVWRYIQQEKIPIVGLYFAKPRTMVRRDGALYRVGGHLSAQSHEEVATITCRYRTLGCEPSTGAVESAAATIEEIIDELKQSKTSERSSRAIDKASESAMEDKKREGYF